jgi:nitrate reductase NapA
MAAATAAAAGNLSGAAAAAPSAGKAPCRFCGTGCHVEVGVDVARDRVVAVRGDRKAPVNKGLLCVKGYHVPLILYGEDRLRTPQVRRDGKLVPISWDEALDLIAERVVKDPKGFAMYGSGQWTIPEGYIAQKFMKGGIASNHIDPNARLCMASAVTGFIATYGVDEPAGCYQDTRRVRRPHHVGQQPRRDAPGPLLTGHRPAVTRREGHADRPDDAADTDQRALRSRAHVQPAE